MSQIIHYVSAPAGSGKTYATAKRAVERVKDGQKLIIAQPTKELMRETLRVIKGFDPTVLVTAIHSVAHGREGKTVLERVTKHMASSPKHEGEILLISHMTLPRLLKVHRSEWHLVVDEMIDPFEEFKMNIAQTHTHMTPHLGLEAFINDTAVVQASNSTELQKLAKNPDKDDGLAIFHDLAEAVLNEDKLVLVRKEAYKRLVAPKGREKQIAFQAIAQPSFTDGFRSVTIMGALLEQTPMFMLWEKLIPDFKWERDDSLSADLQYSQHQNGSRLTIKYLIDGNWSKNHGDQELQDDDCSILEAAAEIVEKEFGTDFLWQTNADKDDLFTFGAKLPTKPHGLNKPAFQACHKVGLLMAVNYRKTGAALLKELGLTDQELKLIQYQNEYQALMRCSLRDRNATAPVTAIVMSRGSAEWLKAQFPGSEIQKLDSTIPEPKKPGPKPEGERAKTVAERVRKSRAKAKEDAATLARLKAGRD